MGYLYGIGAYSFGLCIMPVINLDKAESVIKSLQHFIDARGIIEEMEKLLKPPQKQLISFDKIPRNNIFETAIVSDIDYSAELTDILNIADLEVRKAKIVSFIDTNFGIIISPLRDIAELGHGKTWFLTSNGYLYNFAYPFSQFIED